MAPIALAFKHAKPDKYGNERVGELMLVHVCAADGRVSANRIAADDSVEALAGVFAGPVDPGLTDAFAALGIRIAESGDTDEVYRQLYGRPPDSGT